MANIYTYTNQPSQRTNTEIPTNSIYQNHHHVLSTDSIQPLIYKAKQKPKSMCNTSQNKQ
jgi:hypothetical protein